MFYHNLYCYIALLFMSQGVTIRVKFSGVNPVFLILTQMYQKCPVRDDNVITVYYKAQKQYPVLRSLVKLVQNSHCGGEL